MKVEGVGNRAPRAVAVELERATVLQCVRYADDEAQRRNYGRSSGWRHGLIQVGASFGGVAVRRASYPTVLGKLGECGVYAYLERRFGPCWFVPDFTPMAFGDGGADLAGLGVSIQVKTGQRDRGDTLIRRVNERRQLVPLYAHESAPSILVSCTCEPSARVIVQLKGWMFMRDVQRVATLARTPIQGRSHYNLRVPNSALLPMAALLRELESRCAAEVA